MNGRQAKKFLKRLSVLHLEPGDVVVFGLRYEAGPAEMDRITDNAREIFPGHGVVVMQPGTTISAVRPEPPKG